jgi:hypothetical protein
VEHYVTYFNNLYLPQGLALYSSMERHLSEYTLHILCLDDEVSSVLDQLNLPNVQLLKLSELETEELKRVKQTRTIREYFWTLTPFAPKFVFDANLEVQRVTYLDADLWFRKNPKPIFDELDASGKSVLITDHAYAPEYDKSALSGQYCVQFLTFTRNGGESVRKWWEERCIEWCYARAEDGKFGDQKYLDVWPEIFSTQVHVLQDKERALAPWNALRFPYANAIFYHFHELRIVSINELNIGGYVIPEVVLNYIYTPYAEDLRKAASLLATIGFSFSSQAIPTSTPKRIYRQLNRLIGAIVKSLIPNDILKW